MKCKKDKKKVGNLLYKMSYLRVESSYTGWAKMSVRADDTLLLAAPKTCYAAAIDTL